MNRYVIVTQDEWEAIQAYRQRLELERVQRVLAYWKGMTDAALNSQAKRVPESSSEANRRKA